MFYIKRGTFYNCNFQFKTYLVDTAAFRYENIQGQVRVSVRLAVSKKLYQSVSLVAQINRLFSRELGRHHHFSIRAVETSWQVTSIFHFFSLGLRSTDIMQLLLRGVINN